MAFAIRNLSVLAYANGFTLWHYKSAIDPMERVVAQDYFAEAADMLTGGDLMMLSAVDGARIVCVSPTPAGALCTVPVV
jgi:hypothetical protein